MNEPLAFPSGPMALAVRKKLGDLREDLLILHKALLDDERGAYERTFGRIKSSGEFFKLVVSDEWFAWLRNISGLIVRIDELLESKEENTASAAEKVLVYTSALLVPTEEGDGFGRSYFVAIQRDPKVVLAHAKVRRILATRH